MRPKITHNRLRAPGQTPNHIREFSADPNGNREQRRLWAKATKRKMPAASAEAPEEKP